MADADQPAQIRVEDRDGICIIVLDRPQARNALTAQMRREIRSVLDTINDDESRRAVVITGAGDKAFCSGQDLAEARAFDPDRAGEWVMDLRMFYESIRRLDKPCIAAVNGAAAGAGIQIALLTDIRLGHAGTRMGQPEINVGLASVIGTHLLASVLGHARMVELAMTGRMADAEECHRIGLLQRLLPQDRLLDGAVALAGELADKPRNAMRLTKTRFREMTQKGLDEMFEAAARLQAAAYRTGEPQEVMQNFLDRRRK